MEKKSFASTQINIPEKEAAEIIEFGKALISDEDLAGKGRELQPHVTLKYGVHAEPLTLEKAVSSFKPFDLELGSVGTFPATENSDGAVPVILIVKSDLKPLHDAIHAAMSAKDDDFEYSPHVTLGYVKTEAAAKFDGHPFEKSIPISSVTLSTAGEAQFHISLGKTEGVATMQKFQKFVPLEKMIEKADGTLHVYGLVTAEQPDLEKEVCDYATTKIFYQAKAAQMLKHTSVPGMEPSVMPMREMHTLKAIGKGVSMDFDDAGKSIRMGFEVVDADAIMKFKKGVLIGFSQGGDYVGDKKADPVFKGCVRYTANPGEVSGVDSPCLPGALVESMKGKSFPLTKRDGSIELVKAEVAPPQPARTIDLTLDLSDVTKPKIDGVEHEKCEKAEATVVIGSDYFKPKATPAAKSAAEEVANATVAALIKAGIISVPRILPADPISKEDKKKQIKSKIVAAAKGSSVVEEAAKIFKFQAFFLSEPAKAQEMWAAHKKFMTAQAGDVAKALEMHKSLWDVHDLTDVLSTMAFVHGCLLYERDSEGDLSSVPDDLKNVIEDLVQCYLELVEEEANEIVANLGGKEASMNEQELQKGLLVLAKAAEHMKAALAMHKAHHEARMAIHKAHHDTMKSLSPEHSVIHKAHFDAISGVEKAHHDGLHKAISGITGDTVPGTGPTDISIASGTQGGLPGAPHSAGKAVTIEEITALLKTQFAEFKTSVDTQMEENTTGLLKVIFSATDETPAPAEGLGNREATPPANKVHQTQPISKDTDNGGGGPGNGAPPAPKPTAELAAKALRDGDGDALHALAKTIRANPQGVPASIQNRVTR